MNKIKKLFSLIKFIRLQLNPKQKKILYFSLAASPLSELMMIVTLSIIAYEILSANLSGIFAKINEILHFINNPSLVLWVLFFLYILSILVNLFCKFLIIRLCAQIQENLIKESTKFYLYSEYDKFIQNDQSEVFSNILLESERFSSRLAHPLIEMFQKIFFSIFTISILILFDYKVTIIIFMVLIIFFVFYFYLSKNYLQVLGNNFSEVLQEKTFIIKNIINNFKNIKITNKVNFQLEHYLPTSQKSIKTISYSDTLSLVPKYVIEVCFIGLLLIGFTNLANASNGNLLQEISKYSIFFISFYKLAPSLNAINSFFLRIYSNLNSYYIHKDIQIKKSRIYNLRTNFEKISKKNLIINSIKFKNVNYCYPSSDSNNQNKIILKKITFEINKNEKIAIVGQSGSGKSTLLDLLLLILKPQSGLVLINNTNIHKKIYFKQNYQKNIGYASSSEILPNLKLNQIISDEIDINKIDLERAKYCLNFFELNEFTYLLNKNITIGDGAKTLSTGQIQRICLARALYNEPKILILDEATSNLDSELETKIINKLLKTETILVFCTHKIEKIKKFNKIYFLDKSRINSYSTYTDFINGTFKNKNF